MAKSVVFKQSSSESKMSTLPLVDFSAPLKSGDVVVSVGSSMSNETKAEMCKCQSTVTSIDGNGSPSKPKIPKTYVTGIQNKDSIAYGNVDKRVALTVSPKTYQRDESLYVDKVLYTLGSKITTIPHLLEGSAFYGLLRNALGTSSGLIFPYTPTVSFSHQTNYSPVEIIHSNIAYQYYKNTPPPSIRLSAKFTADNRDNALHMLSAIWFLVACSKCDFGEKSNSPGLPPPVLYLNGYDHLMDNIPVVITSVAYSYPETKHYVNLVLDFSQAYNHRGKEWEGGDKTFDEHGFCKIYNNAETSISTPTSNIKNTYGMLSFNNKNLYATSSRTKGINYSFWLPTDMQIDIGLVVQPNLLKTRKQWTLDGYKTGVLLTNDGKNPKVWLPGSIQSDQLLSSKQQQHSQPNDCPCTCKEPTSNDTGKYVNFIPSGWTW